LDQYTKVIGVSRSPPLRLACYRNAAYKSSEKMLAKALSGTWKEEQIFVLRQATELYDATRTR
jgi:hypothetical protein